MRAAYREKEHCRNLLKNSWGKILLYMPEKSSLRHFISVTRSLVQYITYTTTKVICNVVVAPGICCKVPHHALLSFVNNVTCISFPTTYICLVSVIRTYCTCSTQMFLCRPLKRIIFSVSVHQARYGRSVCIPSPAEFLTFSGNMELFYPWLQVPRLFKQNRGYPV